MLRAKTPVGVFQHNSPVAGIQGDCHTSDMIRFFLSVASIGFGCVTPPTAAEICQNNPATVVSGCQAFPEDMARATEVERGPQHPGDALRKRMGVTLPQAEHMVIVYRSAAHYTRSEWSMVAWKDPRGVWRVAREGEVSSGPLLKIEPRRQPSSERKLSAAEAMHLEELLAARVAHTQPIASSGARFDGYQSWMEIITPERARTVSWMGDATGTLGQIADIVIGRG